MEVSSVGFSLRRKMLQAQLCELGKPWLRWVTFLNLGAGYAEPKACGSQVLVITLHCCVGTGRNACATEGH